VYYRVVDFARGEEADERHFYAIRESNPAISETSDFPKEVVKARRQERRVFDKKQLDDVDP
jgi:hypothetical protein